MDKNSATLLQATITLHSHTNEPVDEQADSHDGPGKSSFQINENTYFAVRFLYVSVQQETIS